MGDRGLRARSRRHGAILELASERDDVSAVAEFGEGASDQLRRLVAENVAHGWGDVEEDALERDDMNEVRGRGEQKEAKWLVAIVWVRRLVGCRRRCRGGRCPSQKPLRRVSERRVHSLRRRGNGCLLDIRARVWFMPG